MKKFLKRIIGIENTYTHKYFYLLGFKFKFKKQRCYDDIYLSHLQAINDKLTTQQTYLESLLNKLITQNNLYDIGDCKFFVPNYPMDYIQRTIVNTNTFYEINVLKKLDSAIPDNALIADIGANIGNHTLYWSIKKGASKIYSFEPVPSTFDILQKNIKLNSLQDKVELFNIGLSDAKSLAVVEDYFCSNIGGTTLEKSPDGDLILDTLDNVLQGKKVDFIKIDTEGHEIFVLQGAKQTILQHRPSVFIEIEKCNKEKVFKIMSDYGYKLEAQYCDNNYLFKY